MALHRGEPGRANQRERITLTIQHGDTRVHPVAGEEPGQVELVNQLGRFLSEAKLGARDLWSLEVAVATSRRPGGAGSLIVTFPASMRDPIRVNFNVGTLQVVSVEGGRM